ncbi:MAG: peptidyl-prolyl cis-trans isomerase [Thermodesulfobacteriota bacterium]|nr:peptidyl-prolyl cis-trans isomerase [Thermodesulfobacteriota bacterium]
MKNRFCLSLVVLTVTFLLHTGVFAWFWEKDYLAKVNQDTIDLMDFNRRMEELHRQRSMQKEQGKPHQIDLKKTLEEMIDDYLLYQEGYRLKLDKDPEFIRRAHSYLEFQSIIRLRKEAIKDKITVTEDEIKEYYEEHLVKKAKQKENFLLPDYNTVEKRIRRQIYKRKEKERERQYINQIKENVTIKINTELLDSLGENDTNGREIAWINRKPILVSDLVKEYGRALVGKNEEEAKKIRRKALDGLIEYLLIKEDAVNQNYSHKDPSFGKMMAQYRISLMASLFKKRIIAQQIRLTEKDLKEYYQQHKEKFREPSRVKLAIIKVKKKEEALSLLEELKRGADFLRLARLKSEGEDQAERMNPTWWNQEKLPIQVKSSVEQMNIGEISEVIETPPFYQIVKLISREKGEIIEFSETKRMVQTFLGRERYQSLLNEYLEKMRKHSKIKINEDILKNLKKKVENET